MRRTPEEIEAFAKGQYVFDNLGLERVFAAIEHSGRLVTVDQKYSGFINEIDTDKMIGDRNKYLHIWSPSEPLQDLINKANTVVSEKLREFRHNRNQYIDYILDNTVDESHNAHKYQSKIYREYRKTMTDEEFFTSIKNDNAYAVFTHLPALTDNDVMESDFIRRRQGLEILQGLTQDDMYNILAEFGQAVGYKGAFYEIPVLDVYAEVMAAEIYSTFDVQDEFENKFVAINSFDRISGEARRFLTDIKDSDIIDGHLYIPAGYTEIGSHIFSGFYDYHKPECKARRNRIKSITVPEGVTRVWTAFSGCEKLDSIVFPKGLHMIGREAFRGCKNLKSIILPDTVERIGDHAFWWCRAITEFRVPKGMTKIESGTFSCCTALKHIEFHDELFEIGNHAFFMCEDLREVVIPNSVVSISEDAFAGCWDLTIVSRENSYAHYYTKAHKELKWRNVDGTMY